MSKKVSIRDTVLKSLSAIGAIDEARFYADLFAAQAPERFALIVLDPRCLKNPLLEALISNIRILSDLGLYPVLLVGALDDDRTTIRFQSQRLAKELESVSVKTAKLNTASYGLIPEVRQKPAQGRVPILELTEKDKGHDLISLARELKPAKIIFLQPSGGISQNGRRVPVVNIDHPAGMIDGDALSVGQARFMRMAQDMAGQFEHKCVYVIASPLNLLAELFTTKGSGTLIRKGATILQPQSMQSLDVAAVQSSLETAFDKPLTPDFLTRDLFKTFIDSQYRGGAILTRLAGLPYLSKFWVIEAAQGEGIARDLWDVMTAQVPAFFWRSRRANPFNEWYMRHCEGMQVSGDWRVFWVGLSAPEIPGAILAAANARDDFTEKT
ncbi:MAG: hypothetical protein ACSHXY_08725 [Alphaproteobacteria bacterium]